MRNLILSLFLLIATFAFGQQPLKIAVISDVHYLGEKIVSEGKAMDKYEATTGRDISDLHTVLESVLDSICAAKTDVLLVSGDITNHGEKASHIEFAEKLKSLQAKGVRSFVIPGNHDVNIPNAKAYLKDEVLPAESVSADEFAEIYRDFGYGNALKRDTASLSYLAAIDARTWLLCFDTNKYREYKTSSISSGRILPATMAWALGILREAKEKDITVLGMMHHGLVEHMPYQSDFFPDYLVEDWQKNAATLADHGLRIVFTGHFHAIDASAFTSSEGNTVTDVETGSLSQYPFPYRLMQLDGKRLQIDTRFIQSIPAKPDLWTEYKLKQEKFVRNSMQAKLKSMGFDFPQEIMATLTELIVRLNLLHSEGDEKPDQELSEAIARFARLLGDENTDPASFQLDFPPADRQLVIELNE